MNKQNYPLGLPGNQFRAKHGEKCINHTEVDATIVVQGETDSFGAEYNPMCAECAVKAREASKQEVMGYCDLHCGEGNDVRPFRDPDEGYAGSVYMACKTCRLSLVNAFNN